MSDIRHKLLDGVHKGDSFTVHRTFSKEDVLLFAKISRDHNPVHDNPSFCQKKNLKGPICHGLLVASMLTEIGGELAWLASSMHLSFRKPVYPGDTITCRLTITDLDESRRAMAEVRFTNQDDALVLEAQLSGILPDEEEKEILLQNSPR